MEEQGEVGAEWEALTGLTLWSSRARLGGEVEMGSGGWRVEEG